MDNSFVTKSELSLYDEKKLINRTQKGESEAFNPIVNKYRQRIYNMIYHRVSDRETAEDICQEVFLKAWEALPKFKGQSALYSWIFDILPLLKHGGFLVPLPQGRLWYQQGVLAEASLIPSTPKVDAPTL